MRQSGFTLLELMVATAVVSVLAILMIGFLTNTFVNALYKDARGDMLHEAQLALDELNEDVRHAANVDSQNRWPDDNAPDSTDPYSWKSDENTLILAAPATDSNNDFIYRDPFAYITYKNNLIYFVDDGTLYRRTLAAEVNGNDETTTCPEGSSSCPSDSKLAQDVKTFHVTYFNANDKEVPPSEARSIKAKLVLERGIYNRTLEVAYNIRSVFRNE